MIKAAVFDMDGTILDTIDDMTDSLNYSLRLCGHRGDFQASLVRYFFGSAALVAVERALASEAGAPQELLPEIGEAVSAERWGVSRAEAERVLEVYRPHYAAHCNIRTGPYPGIAKLLQRLRSSGIRTAVVSNKPDEAVQMLVREQFPGLFDCALGERAGLRRKPAPDMVSEALRLMDMDAEGAIYIGDTEVDVRTAENSHIPCVAVSWGFRSEAYLREVGAQCIAGSAEELGELLLGS